MLAKTSVCTLMALLLGAGLPAAAAEPGDLAEPAAAAEPGDDLAALTDEQAAVAQAMLDFMASLESDFWQRVDAFNHGHSREESFAWDFPENGHYEVRVHRGDVIEKAGLMTVRTTVEKPPFINGLRWNRFIEVAVHPRTPLVGMLHATLSVQVSSKGVGNIGATLDMMQSAQPEEDLQLMRERVSAVLQAHGLPSDRYRSRGCGKPNAGMWKWHRLSTCTGISMYGPKLRADRPTFALASELYRAVVDSYFEILSRRVQQPFGEVELAAQDRMRRRWLEDQLFWDMLAKTFVPYEAWSAVNAPPTVHF